LGARQRRCQIVAFQRLDGGTDEEPEGALGIAAALVVLGEDQRIVLADALQIPTRQGMALLAILTGEEPVRGLADQRVVEAVLALAWESAADAALDHLRVRELG